MIGVLLEIAVLAVIGLLVVIGPTLLARFIGVAPWPMRMAGWGLLLIGITMEFIVWTIGLGATLMTGGQRFGQPAHGLELVFVAAAGTRRAPAHRYRGRAP